jgi:hypothetical protein
MTLLEGRSGPSPMADVMNTEPVPPAPTEEQLGPAEQDLIQWLFEKSKGRKLTQQEINLARWLRRRQLAIRNRCATYTGQMILFAAAHHGGPLTRSAPGWRSAPPSG